MKRKILILLMMTNIMLSLFGAVGCMDNSYHLRRFPDNKEYHFVSCTCPCERYRHSFNRGRCAQCLHYRAEKPLVFIKAEDVIKKKKQIKSDCTAYNNNRISKK